MNSDKLHYLTPMQQVNGMWFKREDLYTPFGAGEVNGGKLRQCMLLVDKIHQDYEGLVTCCSIHSPQAPITAATGRSNVLYYISKQLKRTKANKDYIVLYGINLQEHEDILLGAVADQVRNLPDEINNLVLTCGSGITAIGVLAGLKRYGKKVHNVHLVATAPDRRQLIHETLQRHNADREIHYHDIFHTRGFSYEEPFCSVWGGIKLHPNYEAKTMAWFAGSGLRPEETLFWITGAEPTAAIE